MPKISLTSPPEGWQADYIGLPWIWRGLTRNGVDCWGFAALAWREKMGIQLPIFQDKLDALKFGEDGGDHPERHKAVSRVIADQLPLFETLATPRPMAIAVIRHRAHPLHVGLYATGGFVVQAAENVGHVIQSPLQNLGFGTPASLITEFLWPSDALLEAGRIS